MKLLLSLGIFSLALLNVDALWSCSECHEGVSKVLEKASSNEELSLQMDAFDEVCGSMSSSAQEEMGRF